MLDKFVRAMHYYYPINLITRVKMSCDRSDQQLNANHNNFVEHHQTSDFSIDYLLNRAGSETCKSVTECDSCPKINMTKSELQLDWLNYTRYHPPKIQSMF